MFCIVIFLISVAFHGARAQSDCVPDHVGTITLDINLSTLFWTPSLNCFPSFYLLYIRVEDEMQVVYNTSAPYLDISFLPYCELVYIEIRAGSGNHLSEERHIEDYIPAPQGANLSMSHFALVQEETTVFLIWEVQEQFAHCARGFRVVVRNDWDVFPTDTYTQNNYLFLDDFAPCGKYEIGVMAIYNAVREGPISWVSYSAPPTAANPPVLGSVTLGATYVNMSWKLDSYSVNRCPITSIIVDGSPYINNQRFPLQDAPARPTVNISVNLLQPDRMYLLNVYVENTFGLSRRFPVAVQTLPISTN